jgi:hypothetical protein
MIYGDIVSLVAILFTQLCLFVHVQTYMFVLPQNTTPAACTLPKRKKHWVYWVHDVTILHWLGRVFVPYCVHHLFWPGLMVGTWIVGDGVSYEWWDWFQEIDFTWVHYKTKVNSHLLNLKLSDCKAWAELYHTCLDIWRSMYGASKIKWTQKNECP